jgi:hypothetical protein
MPEWDARLLTRALRAMKRLCGIDAGRLRARARAMLKIEDITYSVEGRPLFEGASATIPTATRSALWAATARARPRSSA